MLIFPIITVGVYFAIMDMIEHEEMLIYCRLLKAKNIRESKEILDIVYIR